jgi:hypothetical protein
MVLFEARTSRNKDRHIEQVALTAFFRKDSWPARS